MEFRLNVKEYLLMKNFFRKKLIRKLCLISFFIYVIVIFLNQQQSLVSYSAQKKYLKDKIDIAKKYNETLILTKDNLESKEYIESISREKLDMYAENERVYININK